MAEQSLGDWVADLRLSASRIEGIVEEVDQLIEDNRLDAAARVLGLSTGKIRELQESYQGLQVALRDQGADPGRFE